MSEEKALLWDVSCVALEKGRRRGIAEGLRMAAKMFRNSKWRAFKDSVYGTPPIQGFDFYQEILAKAKEFEEVK
jgi:hypothetical protein